MELISREEVLSILSHVCNYALKVCDKEYHSPVRLAIMTAIADINILPKIESTPKAEWKHEFCSYKTGIGWRWRCSNCYCVVRDIREMLYCPYCGAYMKAEENENNR